MLTPMPLDDITTWRRSQRERLLKVRRNLSSAERATIGRSMLINLSTVLGARKFVTLGFYWPIQREIDIRPLADVLCGSRQMQVALPVVVQKGEALEYWRWSLGEPTRVGFWNIPVPERRQPVHPDVVVAPLVGFQDRFRLGYGGRWVYRTLCAPKWRPFAIGLGFASSPRRNF